MKKALEPKSLSLAADGGRDAFSNAYLPDWPGFNTVFDMRVTTAVKICRVELDGSFENEMAAVRGGRPDSGGRGCELAVRAGARPVQSRRQSGGVSGQARLIDRPWQARDVLWRHGAVETLRPKTYFKVSEARRAIGLVRHAEHGTWDDSAREMLALSKMNWNNDGLYDPLPVTMSYAKVLVRVLKRMTNLGSTPYQFRFFM